MIGHAFTEYSQVSKLVNDLGFVSDLMGVFFNLTVSTYYIWRVHKVGVSESHRADTMSCRRFQMSGGKWWLGAILMVLNVTTLVVGIM